MKLTAFGAALIEWYQRHARDLPWRRTRDPYAILVSEMMLQQTQVVTVLDYYHRWMQRFPDVATLAAASEAEVLAQWQGLGYYSRARNLHRAAQAVISTWKGHFPESPEDLQSLPGLGKYTAHAVACFAYGQAVPIVDSNVYRVLARIFNYHQPVDTTAGATFIWDAAATLVSNSNPIAYNNALMELGATLCTPTRPQCLICPVQRHCKATEPELLPIKKPRTKVTYRQEAVAWAVSDSKIRLQQSTGPVWRGLWHLPLLAERPGESPIASHIYSITRYRVKLEVFAFNAPEGEWIALENLPALAIPSPHRVAIEQCLKARC